MTPPPSKAGMQLTQAGFEHLTFWRLKGSKCKPESTTWDNSSGWIYSFEAEDRIRYVGIATTVLRSRFDGYSYQLNDTVGMNVKKLLDQDIEVHIYGMRRPGVPKAELEREESRLIVLLNPDWNVRR
jgi:hypothetical protein